MGFHLLGGACLCCRVLVQRFGPAGDDDDDLRPVDVDCRDTVGFFIAKFVKIA